MQSEFARELQFLSSEMTTSFQEANWSKLSELLGRLARSCEAQGCKPVCLKAQSLRELLGDRWLGAGTQASPRLSELFHELLFELSHIQWMSQPHTSFPLELVSNLF